MVEGAAMAYRLTEGNQEGAVGVLSEVGPIASMSPITAMPRSPRHSLPRRSSNLYR